MVLPDSGPGGCSRLLYARTSVAVVEESLTVLLYAPETCMAWVEFRLNWSGGRYKIISSGVGYVVN